MTDARTPPHHVDWESARQEFQSHAHAELPAARATAGCGRPGPASWRLGVAAFAVWFLLFAPTLQHNAQVSPVGTRRTVSLDMTGPVAALSRALQLSHIVSVTGRGNGLSGGADGLTVAGPRPAASRRPRRSRDRRWRHAHDTTTVPPNPKLPDRGQPAARPDRRRLHRPRHG